LNKQIYWRWFVVLLSIYQNLVSVLVGILSVDFEASLAWSWDGLLNGGYESADISFHLYLYNQQK